MSFCIKENEKCHARSFCHFRSIEQDCKGRSLELISLIWQRSSRICRCSINFRMSDDFEGQQESSHLDNESSGYGTVGPSSCETPDLHKKEEPSEETRRMLQGRSSVFQKLYKGGQRSSEPEGTTLLSLQLFSAGQEPSPLTLLNYW